MAAAFAVPQARGAILRFFHIGADKIQFVDTLPPAQQRSLDAGLGYPTTLARARVLVPTLLLPPLSSPLSLHASGPVVSTVFLHGGKPVLLSELGGDGSFLKKLLGGQTRTDWVGVRGAYGLCSPVSRTSSSSPASPPVWLEVPWFGRETTRRTASRRLGSRSRMRSTWPSRYEIPPKQG